MSGIVITEQGVYADIPEDEYHADPVPGGSLSASSAKKLLADGGPAKYRYQLDHPEPPSEQMELGTAAHKLVLGVGAELVEVKADNWRTKAAKEAADEARARGAVPLLSGDMATVRAMADAIREHPIASRLLDPAWGKPEASAFWVDPECKLWRRCRFDWLPDPRMRKPVIADYKTTAKADPRSFAKSIADFRYDMQAAWYCDGYAELYDVTPGWVFIAQEKTPPFLVAVYQLDEEAFAVGREANSRALEIWRDCRAAEADGAPHAWPGYPHDDIPTLALPRWSRAREDFYA